MQQVDVDPLDGVREALGGDGPARARLFERLSERVQRYHRKLTRGDAALAEELTQETMVRALRAIDELRDPDRLLPWAFRIATNVWRDHCRRAAPAEPLRTTDQPVTPAEEHELAGRAVQALGELPEVYRVALTLRYLEGLDYDAMSLILEVSVPTLRSHIARGRKMIRHRLEGAREP